MSALAEPARDDSFADAFGRVLIIDDSAVARAVLARMIDSSDRFGVCRTVATIAAALEFLAGHRVDFILLDIHLPGIDGLTGLPDLLAAGAGARVIAVSSSSAAGLQALALGAVDSLTKPGEGEPVARFGARLLERLAQLSDAIARPVAAVAPSSPPRAIVPAPPPARQAGCAFDMIAIGGSTGGIHALGALLRELPTGFRIPILITQHLPHAFMPYFAAQLAVIAGRPCQVATDLLRIVPGCIFVAPGDAHLRVVPLATGGTAVRLLRGPVASACLPSADPMFASLGAVYRERLLAIVLSGMGRDGADGVRDAREAGAAVVVQDAASSVIWGMPGAVASAGLADAILPPEAIGRLVAGGRRPE